MEFKKLDKTDIKNLIPYFSVQNTQISELSAGYQLMWNQDEYTPDYAIIGRCLVFKRKYLGKDFFYYPLSLTNCEQEEIESLNLIEEYCRNHSISLNYTNIPEEKIPYMIQRYEKNVSLEYIRNWCDYLYFSKDFIFYEGKKFSGQRNHVNKFYKQYPLAQFFSLKEGDENKILSFLKEYEKYQLEKKTPYAEKELLASIELVKKWSEYHQICGYMMVEKKIISLAVGEKCGNMIIVHIEKALREYEGVYPATAQAFAKMFVDENILYLNREDDGADLGLRKSKLQYNPCQLVKKYNLYVHQPLDFIEKVPVISSERLKIKKITDAYAEEYKKIAFDLDRNKYWGYDWRKDTKEKNPNGQYFLSIIRQDFKNRKELSMGIFLKRKLIGEVVLHNFGFHQQAEIGIRLLQAYEGQGYSTEALRTVMDYAFLGLGLEKIEAKCFKENFRSKATLKRSGMREEKEDEIYYYFYRNPKM